MPVTEAELNKLVPLLQTQIRSSRIDCTLRMLLDPIARTVRYHEKSVRLSQREFVVLHRLSGHHGRPVSADDLLTSVWGEPPPVEHTSQIIDDYILHLRN